MGWPPIPAVRFVAGHARYCSLMVALLAPFARRHALSFNLTYDASTLAPAGFFTGFNNAISSMKDFTARSPLTCKLVGENQRPELILERSVKA